VRVHAISLRGGDLDFVDEAIDLKLDFHVFHRGHELS
jgi:hypothetical protein